MQLKPGTLLQNGEYKIIKVLGQGGFGITYLAEQTSLRRKVAIKEFFMYEYCNRDENTTYITVGTNSKKALVEKLKGKFIIKVNLIRNLHHNGVVGVSDVFEENGTAYCVMNYMDRSLSQLIDDKGRLTEAEALRYIRQVSETLKYVHSKGMLHLDIKPGNIMIDEEDNPILIDFGTSKQYDEESGENTSTLLGKTPGYAPLEQYKQGGVSTFSPATDIYALGATLYKLVTGTTPPEADDVNENGLSFPANVHISGSMKKAIVYAMQPKRKDRPQSIEEFLKALEIDGEKTDVIVPEPPAPKFNKKWIWRIICLSCVLFHVFTLVFYFTDGGATSSPFYPHELLFVMLALTMILALVSLFKMGIKTKSKIKDRIIKTVLLLALLSGGGFMLWITFFEMDYYVYRGDEVWGRRTLAYDKDDFWDHRYKDNLIPIYKRSKGGYGLVNGLTAEVVIPYRYDFMREDDISSDCKFIGVELSDKWGVIDRKGNVIIPCVYDNVSARYLSVYGVSYVEKAGKCGLINTDGDVILPIVYDCMELNEQTKTIKICKDEKYGFVNLNGKIIIPLEYDYIVDFKEGRARVKVDGKWGFIDKNNNMVIPCKYKWVSDFNGGQASVETFAGEEYKIDKQGWRI